MDITKNAINEMDRILNDFDMWRITSARTEFTTVFNSELSTLPAYLVAQKEGYDLNVLTDA